MGRLDRASSRRVPRNQIDPRTASSERDPLSKPNVTARTTVQGKTSMALGKVNFSGVTDFKPVPADSYLCTFKAWEHKKNSPTGDNPDGSHILATFSIADGGEYEGKTLRVRWALSDKALWRIRQDLVILGADPEDLAGDDVDLEAIINGQVGHQAILDVKISSYKAANGEERQSNEVTGFHEAVVAGRR
jgi:hypothetical protein